MITKYKALRTTLALGCFSTYVLLAITKYLNINIQSEIVRAYDDTTPWVALNTLACLFALGINFAIPSLISRHNPQKILSCLLTGVSLMLTYKLFFNNTYTLYLCFFTISVLGGTAQTVSQVLINYALSDKYRAGFMGVFNTFYNLAGASGPFLSIVFFPEYTFELFFCFIVIIIFMILVGFFNKNIINLSEKKTEQKTNQLSKLFSSVTIFKRNKLFFFICLTTCLNMVSVVHLLVFWQDSYNLDSTAAKSLQSVFFLGECF